MEVPEKFRESYNLMIDALNAVDTMLLALENFETTKDSMQKFKAEHYKKKAQQLMEQVQAAQQKEMKAA